MAVELTPITLITGLPGSGKSLFTIKTVKEYSEREGRQVYYHGIPDLKLPWIYLEDPTKWHETPKGSIIVIDECQTTFPPRSNGSTMPKHVELANTIRHEGRNLVLITQHPMLIDNSIRKLVTKHYHVERFYGFQKSTIHEFQQVRDNCDKSTKNSIKTHFVYPPEIFALYKSADMHTIKKRIPLRLVLVILLPILLVLALWFLFHTINGISAKKEPDEKKDLFTQSQNDNQRQPQKTKTYLEARIPEIPDIPASAPAYAEVTKPTTAPYPAACIQSKKKGCTCYTQQATKMIVSEGFCKQVVANGYFLDFNNNPQPQQTVNTPVQQAPQTIPKV